MRDIPVFATELGVASLFLKDIPYRGAAYIKLRSSDQPALFLEECVSFCRAAGAERIYASGDDFLATKPHYTDVLRMCRDNFDGEETAALFPVQEHTLSRFLEVYNEAMANVPNAAYMTKHDGTELLKEKSAYFVHGDGALLGIGVAAGNEIRSIAACQKGAGETVLKALCSTLDTDTVYLDVASCNAPAIRLYERLGFITVGIKDRWYQVL